VKAPVVSATVRASPPEPSSPALCAGFRRDRWSRPACVVRGGSRFWRAKLSDVSFTSFTRPPAPFSPTRVVRPTVQSLVVTRRTVHRSGTRSSQYSPNLPDCWRPTCEQASTAFQHCSVPVATRSRPDWVPEPAGAGDEGASVEEKTVEIAYELRVACDSTSAVGAREERVRGRDERCRESREAGEA
jgi:hypothetical protein